jgi:transcriptional regulator with XRE-family HTH domain
MLRSWRSVRRKSQLALAVEAGVSTRHLSFVETGRARPSREMLLTLAEHLDIPLRERNALLEAAGFSAAYRETPLEAPAMVEIRGALARFIEASLPNPALVVNRRYDVLLANEAAARLIAVFAPAWRGPQNVARMLLAEDGLRPRMPNWADVAFRVAHHLRAELSGLRERTPADDEMLAVAVAALRDLRAPPSSAERLPILLPLRMRRAPGEPVLDLFTTVTTLGTPLDITLQELRIETLFPADARSRGLLAEVLGNAS